MRKRVTVKSIVSLISFIFIYSTSAGILESHNHRRPRDLGSMNFGNQAGGNMGPGVNNFGPSDGLRNPERPQLESIYRGKILWGNGTENKPDNEFVFGKGRFADVETDKFGNPIEQPKRGPRPKVKPLRKTDEDRIRVERSVNQRMKVDVERLVKQHQEGEIREKNLKSPSKLGNEIPFEIRLVGESPFEDARRKAVPRPNINSLRNDIVNEGPDTLGDTRSVGDILRAERNLKPGRRPNIGPPRKHINNEIPSYLSSYSVEPRYAMMNEGPDTVGDTRSVGDILRTDIKLKAAPRPNINSLRNDIVNEGPDTLGDTRSVGDILRTDIKLKAAPRPNINPLRNDIINEGPDTLGDTRSVGDILRAEKSPKGVVNDDEKNEGDIVRPRIVNTVLKNSPLGRTFEKDSPSPSHVIKKRDLSYFPNGVEAMYKGPVIESRYKGPQIISQYKGPQIRSEYTGPQIRSQYMGPQIMSEHKGKVIGMLGGVNAYEAMVAKAAATSSPAVICLAQKYDQINREMEREKIMKYVRSKPKLKEIFRDP